MGKYTIIYWADEDMRDIGESEIFNDEFVDLEEAISQANNLFFRQSFACVEVEDDKGMSVYHISSDVPNGERY